MSRWVYCLGEGGSSFYPGTPLGQVDSSATAIFREAQDRRHSSHNPEYRFNNDVPNRLHEQRRLSILSWNPGPRRGKEGAIEKHIAVKWHIIAVQEAIEYFQHAYLTSHFYVTLCSLCCVVQQGHFTRTSNLLPTTEMGSSPNTRIDVSDPCPSNNR